MTGVVDWDLSTSEQTGRRGLSPRRVSIFFGDTPWSKVTAYLVQNSKLPSGTGMTSKEISQRVMVDFDEDSSVKVQRSVDRALVKMVKEGQVLHSADRPRRYWLNSRRKSVREIQRAVADLMGAPEGRVALEAKRLMQEPLRPMTIPLIQRLAIEILVEGAGGDPGRWVPRASIYQGVLLRRPCSQGRVSQVLGIMIDLGIIEYRKEGRNMLYRICERCSNMDAEGAYEEYRKARSRSGLSN